jgi:hypothetical protein
MVLAVLRGVAIGLVAAAGLGGVVQIACAGPSRSHKTAHRDHRFRPVAIAQNGASRSPISAHADRTKRRIAIT